MGVINSDNLGYLWNKIGSAVKTSVTGYLGQHTTYTQAPQKVGTWIDGSSIYRLAFNKNFVATDYINNGVFAFPISELCSNILTNTTNMYIINEFACVKYDSPCIVDDVKLTYTQMGWWECDAANISPSIHDGIFGWIEFITPEDNFKIYTITWTGNLDVGVLPETTTVKYGDSYNYTFSVVDVGEYITDHSVTMGTDSVTNAVNSPDQMTMEVNIPFITGDVVILVSVMED